MNYGTITLNLDKLIQDKGLSKTQLSYRAEISFGQINKFCRNETTRIDLYTIAKICTVLDCDISDLFTFHKPE
nr:helix-turn-helix transcriptional regulator [Lachnospiraceae bacterium]